jgi:hypothetical protein
MPAAMKCPRCGYYHARVSPTAWLWALKNAKERPIASHAGVLAMIAARVNAKTGCGRMSREDLLGDLTVVSKEAVTKATVWALRVGLLTQLQRGHRLGDGSTTKSLWALSDPGASTSKAGLAAVEADSQEPDSPLLRSDPREPQRLDRPVSKAGYPASYIGPVVNTPSKDPTPAGSAQHAASKAGLAAVENLPPAGTDLIQFELDGAPPGPTVNQRAQVITDAYAATKPRGMVKWLAVRNIVARAIKGGEFSDDQIQAALLRLGDGRRAVTLDTLGEELTRPGRNGHRPFDAAAALHSEAAARRPPIIQLRPEPD